MSISGELQGRTTRPRWFVDSQFDAVRIVLGVLLVSAALLKGYQLAAGSVAATSLLTSPIFLLVVIEWELLLGLWLLAGFWSRLLRWTAMLWFMLLLGVALSQAAAGVRSCACLGFVEVAPWVMVAIDAAAVATLWCVRPNRTPPFVIFCPLPLFLLGFIVFYLFLAIPTAAAVWHSGHAGSRLVSSVSTLDLGTLRQGEQRDFTLALRNPHDRDIVIDHLVTSCPCVRLAQPNWVVPAGSETAVGMVLDLTQQTAALGNVLLEVKGRTPSEETAFAARLQLRILPPAGG